MANGVEGDQSPHRGRTRRPTHADPVTAGARRDELPAPPRFATGFVDLDTVRLVDLVEGRFKRLVSDWLDGLDETVRAGIAEVALDAFAGYNAAVRDGAPHVRITVDKFYAVRLPTRSSPRCDGDANRS